jgi:hypothetical protein
VCHGQVLTLTIRIISVHSLYASSQCTSKQGTCDPTNDACCPGLTCRSDPNFGGLCVEAAPTPSTPTPPPAPGPGSCTDDHCGCYTVASGDNCAAIASKFGVSDDAIRGGPQFAFNECNKVLLIEFILLIDCTHTDSTSATRCYNRVCSYCARTVLVLCSYCAHTALVLCSYCTRTVLVLHSYCTRTALVLHSYCTYTVLVLYASSQGARGWIAAEE